MVEAVRAKYIVKDSPAGTILVRLLFPNFQAVILSIARDAFYVRSAECLLALRRWGLTHKEPPPSLEAACKGARMPGVPADPFSGAPLKLTTIDGTLVVYSIGPDGRDDRALKDSDLVRKPDGDVLARMPKVRPRAR